jgi:hypothetical protein
MGGGLDSAWACGAAVRGRVANGVASVEGSLPGGTVVVVVVVELVISLIHVCLLVTLALCFLR